MPPVSIVKSLSSYVGVSCAAGMAVDLRIALVELLEDRREVGIFLALPGTMKVTATFQKRRRSGFSAVAGQQRTGASRPSNRQVTADSWRNDGD